MKPRCDHCRYWVRHLHRGRGTCHRNTPHPVAGFGVWPITLGNDWCGEFKAKQAVKKKSEETNLLKETLLLEAKPSD